MLTTYPVIILVEPQLAVNIGRIARVMLNFKFTELRLVNPRDKNAISSALNVSAGADIVLNNTKIFNNVSSAVEDLNIVYALTKRPRNLDKPTFSLNDFFINEKSSMFNFYKIIENYKNIGFLFGKESSGLSNQDLNYANVLIHILTNEDFDSLNISQAVGILCYEWFKNYSQSINNIKK